MRSLWGKKKIKKKDEKTGEETEVEDYDWDAITKKVKSFIDDYNDVVKEAGESNTKDVLRNASWMTGMTDKTSHLLSKIGITIGKGNKLELDEDELKKADISSLKTVFTGYNSFAGKTAPESSWYIKCCESRKCDLYKQWYIFEKRFFSNVK